MQLEIELHKYYGCVFVETYSKILARITETT